VGAGSGIEAAGEDGLDLPLRVFDARVRIGFVGG